ncbi:MAG: hypothetical protein K6G88_11730 [Lachnospiraceae bacterium]|nr:hypothetical protein [Lachnospiraceae bacterium]
MKKVFLVLKNKVEIKEKDFEAFEKEGLRFLSRKELYDSDPLTELLTEDEDKATEFFTDTKIEVSNRLGGAVYYRDVEFYTISKLAIADEVYDEYNGNLEEIVHEGVLVDSECEWDYDCSEFKNYFPEYAKNEVESMVDEYEDNQFDKLVEDLEKSEHKSWMDKFEDKEELKLEIRWIWDEYH